MIDVFDLDRFHAGDPVVFTDLVRVFSPRLLPALRHYAQGNQDAHDLLQEVWLRAFEKRRTFTARGSLLGWLLTICRTIGLAAVDKRTHEAVNAAALIAAHHSVTHEYSDEREVLRAAILALPDRQRDVVLLRVVEDKTTAEAARILQCAEGSVKATLHHAIRNLQDTLRKKAP